MERGKAIQNKMLVPRAEDSHSWSMRWGEKKKKKSLYEEVGLYEEVAVLETAVCW